MEHIDCSESSDVDGFPLKCILQLYCTCYGAYTLTEYDHVPFKALLSWIGPLSIPSVPYRTLHWYEKNWVTGRLTELLQCPEYVIISILQDIYNEH